MVISAKSCPTKSHQGQGKIRRPLTLGLVAMAITVLLTGFSERVLAQDSLPLDTNLAVDPPQPLGDAPATDETPESSPEELPNLSVPDFSIPQPSFPLESEVPPVPPAADSSTALVGQNIDTVIPMLEQAGWSIVTRTPQLVQLDRDQQGLDLGIEGSTGEVVEAELLEL